MHPLAIKISGLYAIADTGTMEDDELFEKVRRVLAGGCHVLQYRDKSGDKEKRLIQAAELGRLCRHTGAVFIINDDAELAIQVKADGVHCGKDDATVRETRARYPELLIGASCYNSLPRALQAAKEGADYIAFGSFFNSATKPLAKSADLEILKKAKQSLEQPIVAIGGIVAENAGILISSGASAVAVISGVFSTQDPLLSSRKITALFD
ncbi:MAG: thiamine phosphate synthase [Pseudomonadota bacterium]|nr:thiamine phosphate synthase [Pseudomonadota bacterium]